MKLLLTFKQSCKLTLTSSLANGQIRDNQCAYERKPDTSSTFPNLLFALVCDIQCRRAQVRLCQEACCSLLLQQMHLCHPYLCTSNGNTLFRFDEPSKSSNPSSHSLRRPFHTSSHALSFLNSTIYSAGELACREQFSAFQIYLILGWCASRYLHTPISWAAGIVSIIIFIAWGRWYALKIFSWLRMH